MDKNKLLIVILTLILGAIFGMKVVTGGFLPIPGDDKIEECEKKERPFEKKACYSKK